MLRVNLNQNLLAIKQNKNLKINISDKQKLSEEKLIFRRIFAYVNIFDFNVQELLRYF